jgi:lysyl endopeptidase
MRKKSYFHVLFFMIFLLPIAGISQIMQGGTPLSFEMGEKSISLNVPMIVMPEIDIEALRAEDAILDNHKDIPWRFGENIEVDIDLKTSGLMEEVPGGKLWRTAIVSSGAVSINFLFDNFQIPHGASLFIFNEEKTDVIGAFTDINNRDDRMFATVPIRGSHIILEYFEPDKAQFSGELHISRVTHGYRGPHDYAKAFGNSGSCNVNVVCPASAGMENQIRSSAMLVTGGNGFCSGALINNTSNDGTPYFLSADHCYTTPGSVVYWFNWQSATCANPGTSPSYQSISGATNRARYATSDVWLVELSSTPPAGYNVYFSGWNRTMDNNIAGKIWGIHHPSGDIKKISWSTLGASTTTYLQNPVPGNGSHWRVTQWSDGTTTEGGSSGSPLYDPDGRIIGQLHGGYASCSSMTSDWYGKLGVSWTGGGTNATRLSNWLDPTSTGVTVLDGYDPNTPALAVDAQLFDIIVPVSVYTSAQTITPQVTIRNNGANNLTSATVSYTLNGGAPVSVPWTGNLATGQTANVSFSPIGIVLGNHTFVATVTVTGDQDPTNDSMTRNFSVTDCGSAIPVPYSENFNQAALPSCWSVQNGHATNNWQSSTGYNIGGTYPVDPVSGSHFWYVQWIAQNQNEWLITPIFDFTNLTNSEIRFWFNGSYNWSITNDNCDLDLMVRVNGGTWTALWNESDHSSFDDNMTYVWLETIYSLSAYDGQSNVQFAFRYTGNDGANFAVDNISINGNVTSLDEINTDSEIVIFPNPTEDIFTVTINSETDSFDNLIITDATGKQVYFENISGLKNVTIDSAIFAKGMYVLTVSSQSGKVVKKLIIQ